MNPTKELLKQCNYLSVRQMVYFYSVAAVHKTLVNETPEYLCNVLCKALESGVKHRYPTRTAGSRMVAEAKLKIANTSFRWRASKQYAELPMELKTEQNTKAFLNKLRKHTIDSVDI